MSAESQDPVPETTALAAPPAAIAPEAAAAALMTDAQKINQIYKWILEGASDFDVIEATHAAWPDQPIKHLLRHHHIQTAERRQHRRRHRTGLLFRRHSRHVPPHG